MRKAIGISRDDSWIMTKIPIYLNLADAVAIHEEIMELTGFHRAPLRDENLLESALMRPQMAAYYDKSDLVRQAALMAVGISQAQAFLDGNKRTAYACCDLFLRLNGMLYTGDSINLATQLEAIASRDSPLDDATSRFEAWLRQNVGPLHK